MTENNQAKKKKSKKKNTLRLISYISLILASFAAMSFLVYIASIKALTGKFLVLLSAFLILAIFIVFACVILWGKRSKKHKKRSIFVNSFAILFSVLIFAVSAFAGFYMFRIQQSVASVQNNTFNTSLKLYCLNDTLVTRDEDSFGDALDLRRNIDEEYDNQMTLLDTITPIESPVIGIRGVIDTENTDSALAKIKEVIGETAEYKSFVDFQSMVESLYSGEVDFILINDSFLALILDDYQDFESRTGYAYYANFESEVVVNTNINDITTEPFVVYVSGYDRSGSSFSDYARSDVNLLMVVNPVDKKVLLINTPRDYYVALNGNRNRMDKLTHAGMYGIECSMKTLGALYDVDVDYYVKVNFKSVVEIIDAIGGVDVNSRLKFSSRYSYSGKRYYFEKGYNHLTGDAALAFCRERKSLPEGDRDRGKNQQAFLEGVVNRVISPEIITNFNDVLDVIAKHSRTNVSSEEIFALLNMQLTDMKQWTFSTASATGSDAFRKTYSMPSRELYVMLQKESLVKEIQGMVDEILEMD
ncbi:MAG: LCP family protein [Eubacteriaceae bacterium]|nr:LCP family protein [Eubacteriaceae bacterium]